MYTELLKDVQGIQLPVSKKEYADNIYWVYGIVLDDELNIDAKYMMENLSAKGIGTRGFFWCIHEQPVFKRMNLFVGEKYPVAERLARKGFYLPSGITLADEQIKYVVEQLKVCLSNAMK